MAGLALALIGLRHLPARRLSYRMRGIQYAAASRLNHRLLWNTGSPAFACDDSGRMAQLHDLAAQFARGLLSFSSPSNRGRRESRVRAAPAVSRAIVTGKNAHEHTGSAESIRPSLRNGFTAYFAISPVRRALLPPSLRGSSPPSLAPASGARTSRLRRPLKSRSSVATFASTASHRAFVTTRDPPLSSGETGGVVALICPTS